MSEMLDEIFLIEELAMRAWPAEIVDELDGWRLRWHRVPSRRVNSVWPNRWGGHMPLALMLQRVEKFYMLRGQAVCYQICPAALPVGLDEVLDARGFEKKTETAVQVAKTVPLLVQPGGVVEIFETLTDDWLEGYCLTQGEGLGQVAMRREALARVQQRAGYGMVRAENGEPAAVGRGVLDQGWLGIFGMATGMPFRRRGYALAILKALSNWAHTHGAEHMYLQVMENNPGAQALYRKMGFETKYRYHYREQKISS
jgi:ribosomal protein S18 acetylase RimI-like enzyme